MERLFKIMDNIKLLPSVLIFAEVAQRLSITQAAKHLKLSKSGVSQHIQRLEESLGLTLLSRHTRKMALTPAGKRLLEKCELWNSQFDAAIKEAVEATTEPSGTFSVTCPNSLEAQVLVPAITQLISEFPKLEPNLVVSNEPLDLISENLDAAIHIGEKDDSSYRIRKIGQIRQLFCAAPRYLQTEGIPKSVEDLLAHRWISLPWQTYLQTPFKRKQDGAAVSLKPSICTDTLSSAADLAVRGLGVVLLPEMAANIYIQQGHLVPIITGHRDRKWPVNLMHSYSGNKPAHIERFFELVQFYFKQSLVVA